MKSRNPFVFLFIFSIRKYWQGDYGKWFKKKKKIICRFYPTCSEYAIIAVSKYGFIRGFRMSINRIKRCSSHNTESCVDYP